MPSSEIHFFQTIDTPDGPFSLIADGEGRVLASGWTADVNALQGRIHPSLRPTSVIESNTPAAPAVTAYYQGDFAPIMSIRVKQAGTELQLEGWSALREIRPGEPLTYTGFAAALGRPRAVRVAASICARNAAALFVPCHRVLRSDGSLGGFAWGTAVKESLLRREQKALRDPRPATPQIGGKR